MEKGALSCHLKEFARKKYEDFKDWFFDKEHPQSRLNKTVFTHDVLKFVGLLLVFLIVYNNIPKLNQITILFIQFGSILLLISLFFTIRKAWHLGINLKYWFRGLNHGIKLIVGIVIVLLLLLALLHQDRVVDSVVSSYEKVEFRKFSPLNVSLNLSSLNLTKLSSNLNTCPQINVPIKFYGYESFDGTVGSINGKTYDGWSIQGQATCRKGTKEGENLNKYYCGGYTYIMGFGSVNAYVQKTTVSTSGEIGKTYKYVIWNIYDENKNFLETKCLGNPDDFDQKQAQALYNEMLRWS